MWLKVIRTPEAVLVNVCDKDLLGKEFRENSVRLFVSKTFYMERLVSKEEVLKAISYGDIFSFIGEEAVECAYEAGIAPRGSARKIKGVPHLNVYKI